MKAHTGSQAKEAIHFVALSLGGMAVVCVWTLLAFALSICVQAIYEAVPMPGFIALWFLCGACLALWSYVKAK